MTFTDCYMSFHLTQHRFSPTITTNMILLVLTKPILIKHSFKSLIRLYYKKIDGPD